MFTNNYIKYRELMFLGGGGEYRNFVNCDGENATCYARYSWVAGLGMAIRKAYCKAQTATATVNNPTSAALDPGVYFGTGSTPANKVDYKLESPITSGLTITNPSITTENGKTTLPVEVSGGKYTYLIPYIVKNTTESEINIWEIGLFGEVASSSKANHVLFERTVLSEPITIAPGEIKVITYKLTFNQTLNVE